MSLTDLAGSVVVAVAALGVYGLVISEALAALGSPRRPRLMLTLWHRPPRLVTTTRSRITLIAETLPIVLVIQGPVVGIVLNPIGSNPISFDRLRRSSDSGPSFEA